MRLKKAGIVTVGTATALLAASPMAFATDGGKDGPGPGGHGPHGSEIDLSKTCAFAGGDGSAGAVINGDATVGNIVAQVPVAGNNIAQLANCSDFLNNNVNGNLSGNSIAIL